MSGPQVRLDESQAVGRASHRCADSGAEALQCGDALDDTDRFTARRPHDERLGRQWGEQLGAE
ncbi:MAG: hypothetical protein KDB72_13795 [Mycobacterium sp.]|nr:hypothetical protein [Mycobacterium sp.]